MELGRRIVPVMQEYGMTAFVIAGYMEDGEGTVKRFCIAQTGGNPAYEDGLRPLVNFSAMWGATPAITEPKNDGPPP